MQERQYEYNRLTNAQQYEYNRQLNAEQFANDEAAAARQRAWDIEDRDEMRSYSRQVLKHLVEDADAAGINPLAVLNAGGAANYNSAAGMAPLSRTAPVLQATGMTATSRQAVGLRAATRQAVGGSPLAAGIGAAADTFIQNFDPFANDRRNESYRIVGSAIATQNAASLSRVPRGAASIGRGAVVPSKPLVSKVYGPPSPKQFAKENGGGELFVPWHDPFYNKIVWLPNADLPELEQVPIPSLGAVTNEGISATNKVKRAGQSYWDKARSYFGVSAARKGGGGGW